MCGRYGLANPGRVVDLAPEASLDAVLLAEIAGTAPHWNIAPSSLVPTLAADRDGVRVRPLRWGLIPSWAKEAAIGHRLANARDDSVRHKPSFRRAFAARRALVFADLFYEWQARPGTTRKQPWCIRRRDAGPFALAALWERWRDPQEAEAASVETFTLITTAPNAVVAAVHDRMPVILAPGDYAAWLDVHAPLDAVEALLRPAPADGWHAYPIGTAVNRPTFDDPACLAPDDAPGR
jgi:putative SOS response-associated peptidase YedK